MVKEQSTKIILHNANMLTMCPHLSKAQLVAFEKGIISWVGRDKDLRELKCRNAEVIDCGGKTILPGFIDAHLHLFSFAESFVTPDLSSKIAYTPLKTFSQGYMILPGT